MTRDPASHPSSPELANGLAPSRSTRCACGRSARRGKETCFFCAPEISDAKKLEARSRRGQLVIEGLDLKSVAGRQVAREIITAAALRDELAPSQAQVALKAIDGAMNENKQQPSAPPAPLVVEVQRFGGGDA